MKINPVITYSKPSFRGAENKPKPNKALTFGDFVEFAKKDAKNVEVASQKIIKTANFCKNSAKQLDKEAQFYLREIEHLSKFKGYHTRYGENAILAPSKSKNGAKVWTLMDFEGTVARVFEIFDDKKARVTVGLDLSEQDAEVAQKVFYFENGKLSEIQIGKRADEKSVSYNSALMFKNGNLKTVYNNYRFDGAYGKIKGVFEFSPNGELEVYSHKVEFTPHYKTKEGDFLFWNQNSCTYASDKMITAVENGKARDYTRYFSVPISSKGPSIKSIKIDLENMDNAPKD